MNKYLVTVEYPAPWNTERGEVDFVEVEAYNQDSAERKAKIKASSRLKINRVTIISPQ